MIKRVVEWIRNKLKRKRARETERSEWLKQRHRLQHRQEMARRIIDGML